LAAEGAAVRVARRLDSLCAGGPSRVSPGVDFESLTAEAGWQSRHPAGSPQTSRWVASCGGTPCFSAITTQLRQSNFGGFFLGCWGSRF